MARRKAKRELTNIRPREVSHVDEAANEEEFLFVKNKDGSEPNDKEKELFKMLDEATETELNKNTDEVTHVNEVIKEAALKTVREGIEKLLQVVKSIESLEVVEVDEEDIEAVKSLQLPSNVVHEVRVVVTNLVKSIIIKVDKNAPDEVTEKAGRKMSKDKLKKLKEAFSLLENLLKEVETVPEDIETSKSTQPTPIGGEAMDPKNPETVVETKVVEAKATETEVAKTAEGEGAPAQVEASTTPVAAESNESEVLKLLKDVKGSLDGISERVEKLEQSASAPAPNSSTTEEVETEVVKEKPKSLFHNIVHQ